MVFLRIGADPRSDIGDSPGYTFLTKNKGFTLAKGRRTVASDQG